MPTSFRTVLCPPSAPITQAALTCSVEPVLAPQGDVYTLVVLAQRDQLDTALDGDAKRLQVIAQHALGFGLRRGQA